MNFSDKLMFLTELDGLLQQARLHVESLKTSREEWIEANEEALKLRGPPAVKGLDAATQGRVQAQTALWVALDGFLSTWARISLLLFPQDAKAKSRGASLRNLIDLSSKSILSKRDLRNEWMHFDERMDRGLEEFASLRYGELQPQVFRRTEQDDEGPHGLRRVTMDPFAISFLEGSPYALAPMFLEVEKLRRRVQRASEKLAKLPT